MPRKLPSAMTIYLREASSGAVGTCNSIADGAGYPTHVKAVHRAERGSAGPFGGAVVNGVGKEATLQGARPGGEGKVYPG